ncbi:MAG: diaminopimelate decarboxylase [Bacteroidales bacterium]|nr:diaminopimelate decarboxylase [Bacteroidales bacterium]
MDTKGKFPLDKFPKLETPFYYYDINVLNRTLDSLTTEAEKFNFKVHYALKANANPRILSIIHGYGLGADCVSGGEIRAAIQAGFPVSRIVFAGVGKADWEINLALDYNIFCFNVESIPELEVINEFAAKKGKTANIAVRINPNVKADTHHYISTGREENKFGIALGDVEKFIDAVESFSNVKLVGLHFHIGSQILEMNNFAGLCSRVNELQDQLAKRNMVVEHINVGGGLGIDYHYPERQSVPNFADYFKTFRSMLKLRDGQTVHFEPGRSVVGQCGSLITKVLYVKEGTNKQFSIVDAGMTDLIRPALYQAYHKIENCSSEKPIQKYDVVGPICESSDCFGKDVELNGTKRGDYLAIRSAGAYGEVMASQYNLRRLPQACFSDDI